MTSICHNPNCEKVCSTRCSRCKCAYFCNEECAKLMQPFHKEVCIATVSDFPLPEAYRLQERMVQMQFFRILNAFDRTNRIVPPQEDYRGTESANEKQMKNKKLNQKRVAVSFLNVPDVIIEKRHPSASKRCLFSTTKVSQIQAFPGQDAFKLHYDNGTPLQLAMRISSFGSSLVSCVAFISVVETLNGFGGFQPMHGQELLGSFFVAKGYVKSVQPRFVQAAYIEECDEKAKQEICNKNEEHYVIIARPKGIMLESQVIDLGTTKKLDAEAMKRDAELIHERIAWTEALKLASFPNNLQRSEKSAALAKALKDIGVFIAPAATEHDIRLHSHRLCKGIPEWFVVQEIYNEEEISAFEFDDEFKKASNLKMHQLLSELVGADEAVKIIEKVTKAAEKEEREKQKK